MKPKHFSRPKAILDDIAGKRFRLLLHMLYRSVVCLSVTFVHRAQTAEDIDKLSFAYDSPMSPSDPVKI